ncbi:uncharacterized protein RJT20DRAFT_54771 [Scheffersomyces xylosifermentans]|uniref:uncharacterized protein n=1 Tax=Scheffersomyces xylosifermentans TaxID=1304137 RepID=UPI00315DBA7E
MITKYYILQLAVLFLLSFHFVASIPTPDVKRNSVQVVITPQDLKDVGEYAIKKAPEITNNIKNMLKQKLLDRLLSKEIQEYNPNANEEYRSIGSQDPSASNDNSRPITSVHLDATNKPGLVSSIIKGPSADEDEPYNEFERDSSDDEPEYSINEHVGYQRPSRIKNFTKDLAVNEYPSGRRRKR